MRFDESCNQVRDLIVQNSKKGQWTPLTMIAVQSNFHVPLHQARMMLIRFRLDPSIQVKLMNSSSRFKPKEFLYSTPTERVKSLKSGSMQFELTIDENKILKDKLGDLLSESSLKDYLCLMYFCEKFKSSGLHKKWSKINVVEIAKLTGLSETKILEYVRQLQEKGLVVQSPYTLEYRLTINNEEYTSARKEVAKQSLNPEYIAIGKANELIFNQDIEEDKSVIQNFKRSLTDLLKYNTMATAALNHQISLLDGLIEEEKNIKVQKSTLKHLNNEYSKLKLDYDKLKYKANEIEEELNLTDKFLKDYHSYIETETTQLIAKITAELESFFRLPTHIKNDNVINNKVKVNLTTVMVEYQKKLLCYKKGVDIN